MKTIRKTILVACLLSASPVLGEGFGFVLASRASLPVGPVGVVAFAPDGHRLIATSRTEAALFAIDREGNLRQEDFVTLAKEIRGVAFSPDGGRLAMVDDGGALSLYQTAPLRRLATIPDAHRGRALTVAFTGDGSYVVTGGESGEIKVWTPKGDFFAHLAGVAGHRGDVLLVAPVADDRKVISVGRDRRVILWQIDTQQILRPTITDRDVLSAAIGGDGKTLVLGLQLVTGNRFRSASPGALAQQIRADDRIRLVDTTSGIPIRELSDEAQDLRAVGMTPDGRFVAGAGSGSAISIWDAATGAAITRIPLEAPVTAIGFGTDGKWMLAGTKMGSLSLFRLSGIAPVIKPQSNAPIIIIIIEPTDLEGSSDGRGNVPLVATPSVRIRGRIKSAAGIRSLLANGQEITSLLPDGSGGLAFNAYVPMPVLGRRSIEIVAENEQGTVVRRSFEVERVPGTGSVPATHGRRLALIVGISRYADSSLSLAYAKADAQALNDLITDPSLGPASFRPEDVMLLLDEKATVKNINTGLRDYLKRAREDDTVLFYFAGHGAPDPNRLQDLYLLTHDTDPHNIAGTGLLMRHVREAIAEIPARDILILTDACHSAGIAAPASIRNLVVNPIHQVFLDKMLHASGGLAILTASEAAQVSFENEKWERHGVFTYFLLRGLNGAADKDGDHIVTLGELMEYVRDQVRGATRDQQIPAIGPTSFDRQLPLAIVRDPQASPNRTSETQGGNDGL